MRIVCLCGSTKFKEEFVAANKEESLKGNIVLTVCSFTYADKEKLSDEDKNFLDKLHLRKIDVSDEVIILNVGGYIGHSTGIELAYARYHSKPVRFLEEEK